MADPHPSSSQPPGPLHGANPPAGPDRVGNRADQEFDQAASWLGTDHAQRRVITRALVAALALHATVLIARMPTWGPDPVRVDAPVEQQMKVQFLKPPPPPPRRRPRHRSP